MNITILHGENSSASLNYLKGLLDGFKNKGIQVSRISKESPLSIMENISGGDLFNKRSTFVIDDPKKLTPKDIRWILDQNKALDVNLLIFSESELTAAFLKQFSGVADLKLFKLPKNLYAFLDSFMPGRAGACLKLYHELLKTEAPELIFAVFAKHVRDLYWASVDSQSLPYPGWRVSKLKNQAASFGEGKLKKVLKSLSKIDYSTKTSSQDLSSSLDLLIVSLLQ